MFVKVLYNGLAVFTLFVISKCYCRREWYNVTVCRLDMSIVEPYDLTARLMFYTEDLNGDGIMTVEEIDAVFEKYDENGRFHIHIWLRTAITCSCTFSIHYIFLIHKRTLIIKPQWYPKCWIWSIAAYWDIVVSLS